LLGFGWISLCVHSNIVEWDKIIAVNTEYISFISDTYEELSHVDGGSVSYEDSFSIEKRGED
jgi:hypothetical protein